MLASRSCMGGRSLKAGRSRRVAGRSRRVCAKCACKACACNIVRLWEERGGAWAREDVNLLKSVTWVARSLMGTGIAGSWRTGGVCSFACARSCPAMGVSERRRSRSGARESERGCVGGSGHGASGGTALIWRGALCRARCAAATVVRALTMGAPPSMQRSIAKLENSHSRTVDATLVGAADAASSWQTQIYRPDGLAGGLRRCLDVLRADSWRHGGLQLRASAGSRRCA